MSGVLGEPVVGEPVVASGEPPSQTMEHTLRRRRKRAALKRRGLILLAQVVLLVLIIIGWEWAAGPRDAPGTLIDEFYVSTPSAIVDALRAWMERGVLLESIWYTFRLTILGFALGAAGGLIVGFLLGASHVASAILNPFLSALYSVPRLALVPLFMLWFGIGDMSKLALIASVVFFLVFYATFAGVRDVDPELIQRMRLMRASRLAVHTKATLPSAMTFIIAGLNVSGPYALVVAVTAEMLSSNRGMGNLLVRSSGQFHTAGVFAALVVMMVMGIVLMQSIRLLERRLLRWKPSNG